MTNGIDVDRREGQAGWGPDRRARCSRHGDMGRDVDGMAWPPQTLIIVRSGRHFRGKRDAACIADRRAGSLAGREGLCLCVVLCRQIAAGLQYGGVPAALALHAVVFRALAFSFLLSPVRCRCFFFGYRLFRLSCLDTGFMV